MRRKVIPNQRKLIDQLIEFIKFGDIPSKYKRYIENCIGLCFGLSLDHGFTWLQGEEGLVQLYKAFDIMLKWDGSEESLSNFVTFRGERMSLKRAFTWFLERIIYAQCDNFTLQEDCLMAGAGIRFYFKDRDGKEYNDEVKNGIKMAGYFTVDNLQAFLCDLRGLWQADSKIVCLVCSGDHACNLCYDLDQGENGWCLYNPNDSVSTYGCLGDVTLSIIESLGQALCFTIATFKEGQRLEFPSYQAMLDCEFNDKRLDRGDDSLLQHGGLAMIICLRQDIFRRLIVRAEQDDELGLRLIAGLSAYNIQGANGWGMLLDHGSNEIIHLFFRLMMKKDYIASGLGRALTDMFYYRKTIFEVLFSRFPYKVVNLCRLAASNSEIKAGLIKCLGMRNVAGRCLLDVVAEKVPNAFKVLCRMAEKDDEIFQVLVKTGVPVQVIQNVLNEEIRRELCKQGKLLMPISDSLCVSKRERPDGISVEEGLPKKIPCFSSSGVKIMVNLGDEKTGSLGDIRAKHYDESLNCLEGIGGAYDSEGVSDLVF